LILLGSKTTVYHHSSARSLGQGAVRWGKGRFNCNLNSIIFVRLMFI